MPIPIVPLHRPNTRLGERFSVRGRKSAPKAKVQSGTEPFRIPASPAEMYRSPQKTKRHGKACRKSAATQIWPKTALGTRLGRGIRERKIRAQAIRRAADPKTG